MVDTVSEFFDYVAQPSGFTETQQLLIRRRRLGTYVTDEHLAYELNVEFGVHNSVIEYRKVWE